MDVGSCVEKALQRFCVLLVAVLVLAAPAGAQTAAVPDLLKSALSPHPSRQLFAYDFETVSQIVMADETSAQTVRGRIDPSRKKGDRVAITFLEDTARKPTELKKLDERLERQADGDIFCDPMSKEDVTNVVDKGAGLGGRFFTFTPRAEADAGGEIKDLMKKMAAVAVIDEATATLRSFSATLVKKHSVMLIAEIKAASLAAVCVPAPNGRAYSTRTEFNVTGSGFGQTFTSNSVRTVSNLTPAG